MSAPGPGLGDVAVSPPRAPRRTARRARAGEAASIAKVPGSERQMTSEERDLAYLAAELSRVAVQSEARAVALRAARSDCTRLDQRIAAVEQLVARVAEQLAAERATADARVQEAHEKAVAAIRLAEERASSAMRGARATLSEAAVAEVRSQPASARERRLEAELEHLRRERAEHEARLRAQLEDATAAKLELRTRLGTCEHTLAEREAELERERQLADEALRWASSVERELAEPGPPLAPEACAATPPAEAQGAVLRRRGPRVRLRPPR